MLSLTNIPNNTNSVSHLFVGSILIKFLLLLNIIVDITIKIIYICITRYSLQTLFYIYNLNELSSSFSMLKHDNTTHLQKQTLSNIVNKFLAIKSQQEYKDINCHSLLTLL